MSEDNTKTTKQVSWLDALIIKWVNHFKKDTVVVNPITFKQSEDDESYTKPCFIVRYNGEVLKSKVRRSSGGKYSIKYHDYWIECFKDGTVTNKNSLIVNWYLP